MVDFADPFQSDIQSCSHFGQNSLRTLKTDGSVLNNYAVLWGNTAFSANIHKCNVLTSEVVQNCCQLFSRFGRKYNFFIAVSGRMQVLRGFPEGTVRIQTKLLGNCKLTLKVCEESL